MIAYSSSTSGIGRLEEVTQAFIDVSHLLLICGNSANDSTSVPACCWEGVGFEFKPHCVILEILKKIPTAGMPGIGREKVQKTTMHCYDFHTNAEQFMGWFVTCYLN